MLHMPPVSPVALALTGVLAFFPLKFGIGF